MRNKNSSVLFAETKSRIDALNLALAGGEQLDDASLLEIILAQHIGLDASATAQRLVKRFSHLNIILECKLETLLEVDGLTLEAATAILQIRHLTKAVCRAQITGGILLNDKKRILDYCRTLLANTRQEEFHALFLDRRGELQGDECMQRGTIDHVFVYPRELLKQAIRHHASFIILVHNHPFGKASPSKADLQMTRRLENLAMAIGARVVDHIIIAPGDVYSFCENSLLPAQNRAGQRDTA